MHRGSFKFRVRISYPASTSGGTFLFEEKMAQLRALCSERELDTGDFAGLKAEMERICESFSLATQQPFTVDVSEHYENDEGEWVDGDDGTPSAVGRLHLNNILYTTDLATAGTPTTAFVLHLRQGPLMTTRRPYPDDHERPRQPD